MLCETCSSVTWSNFRKVRHEITGKPQYRYVHHESLEALEASSASSCHLCALIYHNLESDSPSADARDDNEPGYMEHSLWVDDSEDDAHRAPPRSPSRVYLYAPSLEGWHVRAYAPTGSTLLRLEALADDYADISDAHLEDSSTGSDKTVALAKIWLRNCLENHRHPQNEPGFLGSVVCRRLGPSKLPTRVLDLGQDPDAESIRLHVSAGDEVGEYAALSHCWGSGVFLATTTQNLDEHQKGLQLSQLPKTFRDAIYFVRKMGVQYLWVDSLCIVQDSKSDWDKESGAMSSVYGNALFSIAAAHASEPADGCFVTRNGRGNRPCRTNIQFRGGLIMHARVDVDAAPSGPLYSRAWVYQEEAMSIRTIVFGARRVSWVCLSAAADENRPDNDSGSPWPPPHHMSHIMLEQYTASSEAAEFTHYRVRDEAALAATDHPADEWPRGMPPSHVGWSRWLEPMPGADENEYGSEVDVWPYPTIEPVYVTWYNVVGEYSKRDLTIAGDRLPAFSGIASNFHTMWPSNRYVAGLWYDDIARGLLWQCADNASDSIQREPDDASLDVARAADSYIAPSWSWASKRNAQYRRESMPGDGYGRVVVQITDVDCELKGENPYGEVQEADLTIQGMLLEAELAADEAHYSIKIPEYASDEPPEIWLDYKYLPPSANPPVSRPLWLSLCSRCRSTASCIHQTRLCSASSWRKLRDLGPRGWSSAGLVSRGSRVLTSFNMVLQRFCI